MQRKLLNQLRRQFPKAHIVREQDFIDVSVRTKTKLHLFEIKTELDPRVVIRQALGQLLEYAYYSKPKHTLPLRLVIVGRLPLTANDTQYLDHLRTVFSLPLEYRVVSL
jgi:hypothetical protein